MRNYMVFRVFFISGSQFKAHGMEHGQILIHIIACSFRCILPVCRL